jgi:hypothetical protein
MRLSMISRIIQTEVNVIFRSEADEGHEADNIDRIILDVMQKPNPIIVFYTFEDIRKF